MKAADAIEYAMSVLPEKMASFDAEVLMLATHYQEDPEGLGYQKVRRTEDTSPENFIDGTTKWAKGPARGLWQFERGGGVKGVMNHKSTSDLARKACHTFGVAFVPEVVHLELEKNPRLAAVFARLLLWTDPSVVPRAGGHDSAFSMYLRVWRPGAYDRGTEAEKVALMNKFHANYARALRELTES